MSEINPITSASSKMRKITEVHHVKPSKKPHDPAFGIWIYGRNVPIKSTFGTLLWMAFRLFVWGLSSHSRIFYSCGDFTIPLKGFKF